MPTDGVKKLTTETDCLVAIQAFGEGPDSYACYQHLLHEITTLKNCFKECNVVYVSSVGNRVAHLLACYARNVENTTVRWDSLPEFILSVEWVDSNCNS